MGDTKDSDYQNLQYQLVTYNEQKKNLDEWFSMFNNLKSINGNNSVESVYQQIEKVLINFNYFN